MPFFSGLLFAIGLGVSGMTRPSKVIAFLDVAGRWDPSLAFVMIGAIGVYLPIHRFVAGRRATLSGQRLSLPTRTAIDARLLGGAAIFGVGWGISGFCPGPALVSAAGGVRAALIFVAAMVGGMILHRALEGSAPREDC